MNTNAFVIERVFNAPVEMVWKALTDKNEMKNWYFDLEEFKAETGFKFQFSGLNKDGSKTYMHLCEVTEVVPFKKLTYSWKYEGYSGNSFVTFELIPEGNKTKLKLSHAGLETFPSDNPDLAKHNFAEGWTYIIGTSLANYIQNKK